MLSSARVGAEAVLVVQAILTAHSLIARVDRPARHVRDCWNELPSAIVVPQRLLPNYDTSASLECAFVCFKRP